MNGRRSRPAGDPVRRLGLTARVAAAVTLTAIAVAVALARPGSARSTLAGPPGAGASGPSSAASTRPPFVPVIRPMSAPGTAGSPSAPATAGATAGSAFVSLVLTAADHRDCPAQATACVDLARHVSWLQAGGKVTFGPVRMEPGRPTGPHQTPRGTFHVAWKAGPGYVSNIYHEPMPWATFFATGGIAFHGGSLTAWSHGCVHLTTANAHYYSEHLPVGAEVAVF